MSDFLSVVVN